MTRLEVAETHLPPESCQTEERMEQCNVESGIVAAAFGPDALSGIRYHTTTAFTLLFSANKNSRPCGVASPQG